MSAPGARPRVQGESALHADLYRLEGEILAELGHGDEARAAFDRADELAR